VGELTHFSEGGGNAFFVICGGGKEGKRVGKRKERENSRVTFHRGGEKRGEKTHQMS